MTDVRVRLKEASRLVPMPDRSFDRLIDRRDRLRRRQRLASLVVAVLVAAGTVGGIGALLSIAGPEEERPGSGWTPTRRLELRPGEYFYLRVTSDEAEDGRIRDEETWWSLDGSGEVRNRSTRQDKYPYPPSGTYGEGGFPVNIPHVESLSTDPETLISQLRDEPWTGLNGLEPDPPWEFVSSMLLETPYASPELRAALFEVGDHLGVTVIEGVRDPAGRPAIALETSERDGADRAVWRTYFDPGTHQAVAWTFESTRGGSAWVLLESGIVDEQGARPTADQWLVPPIP